MKDIRIEKITLNVGAGKEQAKLEKGIKLLKIITGIDPVKTVATKRIPGWGLRPGLPIGCKITLRDEPANKLLTRLLEARDNKLVPKQFDNSGNIIPGAGDVNAQGRLSLAGWEDNAYPGDPTSDGQLSNGADAVTLEFDYINSTQYGSGFEVNDLTQDGYSSGRLSGIDISNEGIVSARFTNGQSNTLGQLAMAKFNSVENLRQMGDTSWSETYASGDVQLGASGTSSFGLIQSGALENSNVDVAAQLVNLIMAQRQFQANAQVITTADTVTQTIINLR